MIKVVDNQDRNKLSEGRAQGMGFAFCKKVDDGYETVQPISPCKDYLNDVIAAERMKTPAIACGLIYKPQELFKENEPAYLAFKIMPNKYNSSFDLIGETARLKRTIRKIQGIINDVEQQLNIATKTVIEKATNDTYLCTVPPEWIGSTYMISLYTLIIRIGQYFTPVLRPTDLLYTIPAMEGSLWLTAQSRLQYLIKTKEFPKQEFKGVPGSYHSAGIVSMQLPLPTPNTTTV